MLPKDLSEGFSESYLLELPDNCFQFFDTHGTMPKNWTTRIVKVNKLNVDFGHIFLCFCSLMLLNVYFLWNSNACYTIRTDAHQILQQKYEIMENNLMSRLFDTQTRIITESFFNP